MPQAPERQDRLPGMMWFCTPRFFALSGLQYYSPNYRVDWAEKRLPLVIFLPDRSIWCPDRCPDWGTNVDVGWKVTGEIPLLTAYPSIGKPGYHGWLNGGILSDDLEGRTYPSEIPS